MASFWSSLIRVLMGEDCRCVLDVDTLFAHLCLLCGDKPKLLTFTALHFVFLWTLPWKFHSSWVTPFSGHNQEYSGCLFSFKKIFSLYFAGKRKAWKVEEISKRILSLRMIVVYFSFAPQRIISLETRGWMEVVYVLTLFLFLNFMRTGASWS